MSGQFIVNFRDGSSLVVGTDLRAMDKLRGKRYPRVASIAHTQLGHPEWTWHALHDRLAYLYHEVLSPACTEEI